MPVPNMPTDGNSHAMQTLKPGVSQRITMTGSSDAPAAALATDTKVVRISGNASVHYTADGTADAASTFLAAGAYEYIAVDGKNGELPEFLNPSGAVGFIVLTEMV